MAWFWKYLLVAVLMFLLGSATVVAAPDIKQFVISSEDGARLAEVSAQNRLLVETTGQVSVSNLPTDNGSLPDPANIVNFFPTITGGTPGDCTEGFDYLVPHDKSLLITDLVLVGGGSLPLTFWTNARQSFFTIQTPNNKFSTPLVINAGERLCLSHNTAGKNLKMFIAGVLSPAPSS